MDSNNLEGPEKGLLQSDDLYKYILETNVYPREAKPLKELRKVTSSHPMAKIATAPDAGQLMSILMSFMNVKKSIEIGVFTGYSLLLTALTIPEDAKIIAIDKSRESYEIGLPIIRKAGVEHKIEFIESEALPILDQLLEHPQNMGSFDFAYVDADRENFWNYHERLMKLLKVGGVVVYDNTLWYGTVVKTEDSTIELLRKDREFIIEFNKLVAADQRVQVSQVPAGDNLPASLLSFSCS